MMSMAWHHVMVLGNVSFLKKQDELQHVIFIFL